MKKPKRKQPRRMTPPLVLRSESDGERSIVEVDDAIAIRCRQHSGRITAYLSLAPGLTVRVLSRCVNKRRIPRLLIQAGFGVE